MLWAFLNPILMLAVYTFVFSVVFQARWGGEQESKGQFAIVLFAGLIVHGLFAEVLNRAPQLVLSNANCRIPDDHKDAYETGLAENRTSPS